jgi:hypothetical protein
MVISHASGVVAVVFVRAIQALRLAVATQEFGQADGVVVTQKLKISTLKLVILRSMIKFGRIVVQKIGPITAQTYLFLVFYEKTK